ncbi:MAG: hypothetical protein RI897_3502 [Verrucomicrobiota bacterium]
MVVWVFSAVFEFGFIEGGLAVIEEFEEDIEDEVGGGWAAWEVVIDGDDFVEWADAVDERCDFF